MEKNAATISGACPFAVPWLTKPINGGPPRKPPYPMEVMAPDRRPRCVYCPRVFRQEVAHGRALARGERANRSPHGPRTSFRAFAGILDE